MAVRQNPVLREVSRDNDGYRGLAVTQMNILKDYMRLAGLRVYSRKVELADGAVITCKVNFNREDMFVEVPGGVEEIRLTPEYELTLEILFEMFSDGVQWGIGRTKRGEWFRIPLIKQYNNDVLPRLWSGNHHWTDGAGKSITTQYVHPSDMRLFVNTETQWLPRSYYSRVGEVSMPAFGGHSVRLGRNLFDYKSGTSTISGVPYDSSLRDSQTGTVAASVTGVPYSAGKQIKAGFQAYGSAFIKLDEEGNSALIGTRVAPKGIEYGSSIVCLINGVEKVATWAVDGSTTDLTTIPFTVEYAGITWDEPIYFRFWGPWTYSPNGRSAVFVAQIKYTSYRMRVDITPVPILDEEDNVIDYDFTFELTKLGFAEEYTKNWNYYHPDPFPTGGTLQDALDAGWTPFEGTYIAGYGGTRISHAKYMTSEFDTSGSEVAVSMEINQDNVGSFTLARTGVQRAIGKNDVTTVTARVGGGAVFTFPAAYSTYSFNSLQGFSESGSKRELTEMALPVLDVRGVHGRTAVVAHFLTTDTTFGVAGTSPLSYSGTVKKVLTEVVVVDGQKVLEQEKILSSVTVTSPQPIIPRPQLAEYSDTTDGPITTNLQGNFSIWPLFSRDSSGMMTRIAISSRGDLICAGPVFQQASDVVTSLPKWRTAREYHKTFIDRSGDSVDFADVICLDAKGKKVVDPDPIVDIERIGVIEGMKLTLTSTEPFAFKA